ncbi:unnamed protein product [Didymodactylos carnosus]|uniref:DUF5722 domain-containing protein n=1 Tax=Didymodactylos carnosus TaxID=1234261 RepID=A0A814DQG1_9BILA|nr:unnamed protein product [Didymodactylos carnosus]CAF3732822.1 unnamed protein product [Didymodactylos carnosus]
MCEVLCFCATTILALINQKYYRPPQSELNNPNIYPKRSFYGIKAIQPDDWKIEDLTGNGVGGKAPCSSGEVEYDGYCFIPALDAKIKMYSDKQFMITGILIVPPAWARKKNTNLINEQSNGKNNVGRIVEFVIMNEVNAAEWYNVGCGNGKTCDIDHWVKHYSQVYSSAYDQIKKHQPQAPVLISLEHHFDSIFDKYVSAASPFMSGRTFLTKFASQIGNRDWSVAFHSYPPSLLRAEFDTNDWPKITFGNVNRLVGWLMQTFPNKPSTWKVYLTENGINSLKPHSDENKQHDQLCKAFQNILATPNIELFIYHRLKDHPGETKDGLGLGLVTDQGQYKRAWSLWALVNRYDVGKLSCGFELLPYVSLKRANHPTNGHWTTTRILPNGYKLERQWKLFREQQPGTKLIFECQRTGDMRNFPSVNQNCEKQDALGPLGYIYNDKKDNTSPVYRCRKDSDYFISPDSKCEGATNEGLLGYAL